MEPQAASHESELCSAGLWGSLLGEGSCDVMPFQGNSAKITLIKMIYVKNFWIYQIYNNVTCEQKQLFHPLKSLCLFFPPFLTSLTGNFDIEVIIVGILDSLQIPESKH